MQDKQRKKEDLVRELEKLRKRIKKLEKAGDGQKATESVLRAVAESEESYRRITNAVTDYIYTVRTAWGEPAETIHGPACAAVTGFTPEDFACDPYLWINMVHGEDRQSVRDQAMSVLNGKAYPFEHRITRKDGTVRWVRNTPVPHYDEQGRLISYDGLIQDITEKRMVEDALRASEERYRNIFENAVEGIFQSTPEGRFLHVNPAMARFYGYGSPRELIDSITDIQDQIYVNPADRQRFKDHLEQYGAIERFESERYSKDGTTVWTSVNAHVVRDASGKTLYYEGTSIDISERKKAEEENKKLQKQLFQAQKMEAIGTLAGGIAHDFNNMLMGVQGYASLMLLDTKQDHPHYEKLRGIEQQVQSGADLTRQLLGFAQGGKYEVKPTDLNELVRRTADMFGRTKREITIHRKLNGDLYPVDVDRGQIEQALLNLYVNAWHAMPAGGKLYIESRNLTVVEGHSRHYSFAPGRYVKLSVTDDGVGMDEETQQRIFEPFFTTKEMGHGTGLGLASVYGIVKSHGGVIDVYSEEGKGTTFTIYLPASEKEVIKEKEVSGDLLKGTETILLVDDQETVLGVGEEMLKSLGYTVISARNGREAMTIYEKDKDMIDLVILDMIMPEMTGGEAFEGLKTINDRVAVILSSGYSINGMAAKILGRGCKGFIQKPFNINELSRKLREILDTT